MENRNEFKNAIREHLIKMMAEEIAKESDFEALKSELKAELMKVERKDTRSEREKAEEYIPYSTPTTERERAYKKEMGFFMKEDFEKQLEKKISAEKAKNKMAKHVREEEVDSFITALNRPRLEPMSSNRHVSVLSNIAAPSSLLAKLQQIKNTSQSLMPSDNPTKTDYSMVDNVHQLTDAEKPFEPIPEKEFNFEGEAKPKVKKVKVHNLKKTPKPLAAKKEVKATKKVKTVTAGKKPRKK